MVVMIFAIFIGTLVAFLFNWPFYLHQKRLLRLAKARLDIARTVTSMERLMLSGKIKSGDICHDKMYHAMLRCQYATKHYFPWKFWTPPSRETREMCRKLHQEAAETGEIGELLRGFYDANIRVLNNGQPYLSKLFAVYVIVFCGGLKILVLGLISIVKVRKSYLKFRELTAEWCMALEESPKPQFGLKAKSIG